MQNQAHDILWRRLRYFLTPQFDIYASLFSRFAGRRVLEVGFGTGGGVLQYASSARLVDAIEIDPGAVDFANKTFPLNNVNWIEGDICTFQTRIRYDAVVMIETLEHIPDYKSALTNIRKLLHPGGDLVMSARNANADLRRWKDLHEREWTSGELVDELRPFFEDVWLYDWSLTDLQTGFTSLTPLVAVARRGT
jgi:2-polyprenyl-3-methyl-5-hydroxy-6-metoxy-1,4-benzoquinol methylase